MLIAKNMIEELSKDAGFTILEVITAIFILTVGVGGAFSVITQTFSISSDAESRLTAAYLAQEGVEIVKNIRDTNWLESRSGVVSWDDDLSQGDWEADYNSLDLSDNYDGDFLKIGGGFYNYSSGNDTKFKRKITLTPQGADEIQIKVTIEWTERGRTHDFEVLDKITNWYDI